MVRPVVLGGAPTAPTMTDGREETDVRPPPGDQSHRPRWRNYAIEGLLILLAFGVDRMFPDTPLPALLAIATAVAGIAVLERENLRGRLPLYGAVVLACVGFVVGGVLVWLRTESGRGQDAPTARRALLTPEQHNLLARIDELQRQLGARKLVVLRNGQGHAERGDSAVGRFDLVEEFYGATAGDAPLHGQFEALMESMPAEYVRTFDEARLDSPFVVSVTDEGRRYLATR